jgi:thiol-disulfide isomerase/thioredoxin
VKKFVFFGVMVAAVTALVVVFAYSSVSVSKDGVKVAMKTRSAEACNQDVPASCLPQIGYLDTGDTMWTNDLLEGKVVLVTFWATWCGPCKVEVPALTAAYRKYKDQGFVLLGVLMDSDDVTDEQLAVFARQYSLDYPVVRVDQDIWSNFGHPDAMPTTFIYDRAGRLHYKQRGAVNEGQLAAVIEQLLRE